MGDGGVCADRGRMPGAAAAREGAAIGFELVMDDGAEGTGPAVGPRMVLPLGERALVTGLFMGLLSHALRRGTADRGPTVGVRLDCNWSELSAVLAMVAQVREGAARWGLRFRVRADTGRMFVTVASAHDAATGARARASGAGAKRERGA